MPAARVPNLRLIDQLSRPDLIDYAQAALALMPRDTLEVATLALLRQVGAQEMAGELERDQ